MGSLIDQINANDAYYILKKLYESDESIARKIEEVANLYLSQVDREQIANNLFLDLDFLEVEELWDSSGSTRYGYIDTGDRAYEMVEEVIEPYLDEMKKYYNLGYYQDSSEICIGILQGLIQFDKESKTQFREWAEDIADAMFEQVWDEYKELVNKETDILDMEEIVAGLREM